MRPPLWSPPVELSSVEQTIVKRIRRAKLFVFLRERRHELFDAAYQEALGRLYAERRRGQPPVPPAQLALATVLQAYVGCPDDEVVEATTMDRRWQLVLDCLDASQPPFSKGTPVAFRQRLIRQDADRRLIERTVALAERRGGFGSRALRAALDNSPLWGAGRVEDTYNLLGHAPRKALGVVARQQGRGLAGVATEAGAPILGGPSSKATLDLDWDDPAERTRALVTVLDVLSAVERYMDESATASRAALDVAHQVRGQDVEPGADGTPTIRPGAARERRISIEDAETRHGRKSRGHRVDGYKRHVLRDLDVGLIRAVGITPANIPAASVTDAIAADLDHQVARLGELHIDWAYLSSTPVRERPADLALFCKAWPVRNGDRFPKTAFALDWEQRTTRCPNGALLPFVLAGTVHFPAATCAACSLRNRCTTSAHGRSVTVHPDEHLLTALRSRQATPAGRAKLRERVAVEHALAHVGRWQGRRARYRGARKNLFDLRRCAVVHNLHVLARLPRPSAA